VKGARGVQAAETLGATLVYDLRKHPDPNVRANNGAPRPITVDQAFLDEKPEWVERFLQQIIDVGNWSEQHEEETIAYIARESRSTPEYVRKAYGEDAHLRQQTDLSTRSIEALTHYKNFLLQEGFIESDIDIEAWIDPAPLRRLQQKK